VTELPERAFEDCLALEHVELPRGMTYIGDGAFCWCDQLREVRLPDALEEIGEEAFCGCHRIRSVVIPRKTTMPDGGVFEEETEIRRQ
jgi:hypothetical protein